MRRNAVSVAFWCSHCWSACAGAAAAQETRTPIFKAPYRAFENHEFGASISDPGEGVERRRRGLLPLRPGRNDFGVRAGFADFDGSAAPEF